MKINYEYTKADLKNYLLKSRVINNIILFIIGIMVYLFFLLNKISLIYFPFYIIGLIIILYILNILYIKAYFKVNEMMNNQMYGMYTLELTSNKFSITINKVKTDYKYNKIKKLIEKKDKFILKFNKSRESLIFEKKNFDNQEYIKVIEKFNEKIK